MSWYTTDIAPGEETRVIAFCRRCVMWDVLAEDDPALFSAWLSEHRCATSAKPSSDELDGWTAP